MSRLKLCILVQVILLLFYLSTVQALEDLSSPSRFRVRSDRTVHWSAVENAIAYVVAWGTCERDTICPWFHSENPGQGGARTKRISASPGKADYTTTLSSSLVGWYGVSVHPVGDGITYKEYSSIHSTRIRFGSAAENRYSSATGGGEDEEEDTREEVFTCTTLPPAIVVTALAGSHPQCTRLDGAGIGVQSIVDSGFIDAVDVWGPVSAGVKVCFRAAGDLLFLDAVTSPRSISSLEGYLSDGMTCAEIYGPGSVVLIPGEGPTETTTETTAETTALPVPKEPLVLDREVEAEEIPLDDCTVTTTHSLNFRAIPAGTRLTVLRKGTTVTALARTTDWHEKVLEAGITLNSLTRTTDWFKVDHDGNTGWISADYVTTEGSCDESPSPDAVQEAEA